MTLNSFRGALLVAILVAASTSTPSSAAPVRPSFSAIPIGSIPAPPDPQSLPAQIAASEHVAGLDIGRGIEPRVSHARVRPPQIATVGAEHTGACLTDFNPQRIPFRSGSSFSFPFASAPFAAHEKGRLVISEGVHAIRMQSLVQGSARPHLEITDAWIDPKTLGARTSEHTEVPLARIAQGPLGSQVFAFRDASRLWLVVEVPERGVVIGPQPGSRSGCGHVLTDLEISSKGAVANFLMGARTEPDNPRERAFFAAQLSASVSRSSRDRAPVLSISVGAVPRELESAVSSVLPREPKLAASGGQRRK